MTEQEFVEAVKSLKIEVKEEQLKQLNEFYDYLIETNKSMNLTRIVDKKEVYLKHFYDSLTIAKIYNLNQPLTLVDVGTGAGFPGIVLKIFFPDLQITLIDALQKRVNYLKQVIEKLNLTKIEVKHNRAEELIAKQETYDIVVARAVASLEKLLPWTMPLVNNHGVFIAMKANVDEELEKAYPIIQQKHYILKQKEIFYLPKEGSKRTLLLFEKKQQQKY